MAAEKKKEVLTEAERIIRLRQTTLSKLDSLTESDTEDLMQLSHSFFSELYDIRKKLTIEELRQDILSRSIASSLKDKADKYLTLLSEAQYDKSGAGAMPVKGLTLSFRIVIKEFTDSILVKKKIGQAKGMVSRFLDKLAISKLTGQKDKGGRLDRSYDVGEIFSLVNRANLLLGKGNYSGAKKLYFSALDLYDRLPDVGKREAHFHLGKLHARLDKAMGREKGARGSK